MVATEPPHSTLTICSSPGPNVSAGQQRGSVWYWGDLHANDQKTNEATNELSKSVCVWGGVKMNKGSGRRNGTQLSLVLWSLICIYIVSSEFHIDPENTQ